MGLPGFHPFVSRWFTETLGEPTAAQRRGWDAIRQGRHTLIAAPTGSGKTLAAFLIAINDLVEEASSGPLPDEVRVIYVSPLKALSADIHKNLAEPRRGIHGIAQSMGAAPPRITAAVRSGDTTPAQRAAMLRTPPHILVTTPESLYLLVTSGGGRQMLRTVRTVIVDEIHAVIGTRRGAHLALSLERLQQIAEQPLLRVGLSATQKPVEEVARFLVGVLPPSPCSLPPVVVDEGHRRPLDLAIEIPRSPLDAVMAHEVWEEYYDRLTELIGSHKTTLIFVNTRRLAERLARHLSERLGDAAVAAHHGSLSKETRLDAETRLKSGTLRALVATASLELGIDIGHVDLVCQIGSPHRIATLLQRVGRSGHTITGVPKGRVMPLSRDDLVECAALLRSVRHGELDRIVSHETPLDVLAQQLAAELACRDYTEDELFALVCRAWPYRSLARNDFDAVIGMLSDGFATRRGRRAALVHRDEVHGRLRGRRGTRMLALTSGGAIPEVADYRVVLEPDDTFIGTLNEDFAIESMAGDVFQLGMASWRVVQVAAGTVRVADAHGSPPNIPFWLGEAPARSDELSRAVSDLRADVARLLDDASRTEPSSLETHSAAETHPVASDSSRTAKTDSVASDFGRPAEPISVASDFSRTAETISVASDFSRTIEWLETETGICRGAAEQIVSYLADGRRALGVVPTQETLVLERFFDESGGMQLVLHAPYGSRINRAWGLALRKRFCRQFNFELQAAATDEALMLSLGPQHSFPLSDVFRYLHPATARDILVQAFLDAPVFQTRWRWNATISLAVPRNRGGRKVPPQLQRTMANDLMAAIFPDAAACLENIPGDREIPDHPLVGQTVRDCLSEAMDFEGLSRVLVRIHAGDVRCVSRDTPEPSPFADEILNARPYAFLDDAPLEERRAQAVQTRQSTEQSGSDLGALDEAAIGRVRDEERPDPRDADELHDAMLTYGFLMDGDPAAPSSLFDELATSGRATRITAPPASAVWVAAERLPEMLAVHPDLEMEPVIVPPASRVAKRWSREAAVAELLRGRLMIAGPTTALALAESCGITEPDADSALITLESEGVVLRGRFSPSVSTLEWCDRRLLARIHRYTLHRLRGEISACSPADFMRFLFVWQHVHPSSRLMGTDGLRAVLAQLDGVEIPARTWERDVLPTRVEGYDGALLDTLCLTGEVAWARLSHSPYLPHTAPSPDPDHLPYQPHRPHSPQVATASAIALFMRDHAPAWFALREASASDGASRASLNQNAGPKDESDRGPTLSQNASRVLDRLRAHGASFAQELHAACEITEERFREAISELVSEGLVSSDGFAGVRSIVAGPAGTSRATRPPSTGRWFALGAADVVTRAAAVELWAWTLLRRYGVIFRRLLAREATDVPWRELVRVYRRLEARGEIRGGRFVSGVSGEQFALPDAVDRLREVRRSTHDDQLITIAAADPLNLTGILTSDNRIRASVASRIVYRNGIPVAAMEGDFLRALAEVDDTVATAAATAAAGRPVPVLSGFVGRI